jgi:hypothetical protein
MIDRSESFSSSQRPGVPARGSLGAQAGCAGRGQKLNGRRAARGRATWTSAQAVVR